MIRRGNPDPVASALAAARRAQGVTLVELSHRLGHGDTARTRLSMWERGITSPTLHSVRRWAEALDLDLVVAPREGRTA